MSDIFYQTQKLAGFMHYGTTYTLTFFKYIL